MSRYSCAGVGYEGSKALLSTDDISAARLKSVVTGSILPGDVTTEVGGGMEDVEGLVSELIPVWKVLSGLDAAE